MSIEIAQRHDVPALRALIESAYRGDSARAGWSHEADLLGGQRTDEAALAEMLDDPEQHVLVQRGEAGLDGCIALTHRAAGLVYVGMVTVAPELQGRGRGSVLLAAAEDYAIHRLGADRAEMTVIVQREELIAWYQRRGYCPTGERRPFPKHDPRFGEPKRDDLEFIVLEKALRSPASPA